MQPIYQFTNALKQKRSYWRPIVAVVAILLALLLLKPPVGVRRTALQFVDKVEQVAEQVTGRHIELGGTSVGSSIVGEVTSPGTEGTEGGTTAPETSPQLPPEIQGKPPADIFLYLVNTYRRDHGLPEISVDQRFCQLAQTRLEQALLDWSQEPFTSNKEQLAREYCPECKEMGESGSRFFATPQGVFDEWLALPDQKKQLDSPYQIGCVVIYTNPENQNYLIFEWGQT